MRMSLWLIGAGPMALQYAKVLNALGQPSDIVGRSDASANWFEASTDLFVQRGGVSGALAELGPPDCAIVSVGIDELALATSALVVEGSKSDTR